MNPHPPSGDDENFQQCLSFLNNSLEIHPMNYEISEERTHLGTEKKMTLKNNAIPRTYIERCEKDW